jgi:hypothetical protein
MLLAGGFIGAVALGIAIGPSLTHRDATGIVPGVELSQPAAAPSRAAAPRARTSTRAARAVAIPASTPALQTQLKPLLNVGTNMTLAADGFRNAEQFATVAHAARNTEVPFVLLKHRVLNEGQTLADAIRASKPEVDAARETNRARIQAMSDIASISS